MKYYVLVSYNMEPFKRCLHSLGNSDITVVINTLDTIFESTAKQYCLDNNIDFCITASDGTPGTGKNSLLKIFLSRNDEHMVMIDGDDFLTPHGLEFFNTLHNPPDVICNYNEVQVFDPEIAYTYFHSYDTMDNYPDNYRTQEFVDTLRGTPPKKIARNLRRQSGLPYEECYQHALDLLELNEFFSRNGAQHRILLLSKKAASTMNYSNLMIGEDYVEWLKLRYLSYKGELEVYRTNELPKPKYLYVCDHSNKGLCLQHFLTDFSWSSIFLSKLSSIGLEIDYQLPEYLDK